MIIGVSARKRHGKDTVCDYLVEKYGFEKYSLASPLKRGAMEIFGLSEEQVFGDLKEVIDPEWGCTPRELLQVLGTELLQFDIQNHIPSFKEIGRKIWVKNFFKYYKKNSKKNIVISDCRFVHETKSIAGVKDTIIIKVVRPGMLDNDTHSSEMEIDQVEYDYLVINDGTLEELYAKIDAIVENK
jgi:hypothetical protein